MSIFKKRSKEGSNAWLVEEAERQGFTVIYVNKKKKLKELEQRINDLESLPINNTKLVYQQVEEVLTSDLDT